jgi:hypothetical protein
MQATVTATVMIFLDPWPCVPAKLNGAAARLFLGDAGGSTRRTTRHFLDNTNRHCLYVDIEENVSFIN